METRKRGYIMPIGGREDKSFNASIIKRFIEISGGKDAIISVIPTASKLHDTGDTYVEVFKKYGVKNIYNLKITSREDANEQEHADKILRSTGVFMTGGNQLLLSTILGGTKVAKAIRDCNKQGGTVAGTSAGAAFIPEHMLIGGASGREPRFGGVSMAPGLGLTNKFMIDQHFNERNRLGRLLAALAYNPYKTGVGVDEDTAAIIDAEGNVEAVGSGYLTVVNMSNVKFTSLGRVSRGDKIDLVGKKIYSMTEGDRYITSAHELVRKK